MEHRTPLPLCAGVEHSARPPPFRTQPLVFAKKKQRSQGRFSRDRKQPPGGPAAVDARDYKREYYLEKLGLHPNDREGRASLVGSYMEGLRWCLAYYHEGCASWDWYFPNFYAPLASDLIDLPSYETTLERGEVS